MACKYLSEVSSKWLVRTGQVSMLIKGELSTKAWMFTLVAVRLASLECLLLLWSLFLTWLRNTELPFCALKLCKMMSWNDVFQFHNWNTSFSNPFWMDGFLDSICPWKTCPLTYVYKFELWHPESRSRYLASVIGDLKLAFKTQVVNRFMDSYWKLDLLEFCELISKSFIPFNLHKSRK